MGRLLARDFTLRAPAIGWLALPLACHCRTAPTAGLGALAGLAYLKGRTLPQTQSGVRERCSVPSRPANKTERKA